MFARLLWQMIRGNRGRLAVALVAVVSGAAVISALLNLDLDLERKLTQEFRMLGANLVISSHRAAPMADAGAGSPALVDESAAEAALDENQNSRVAAAAPFLYIAARATDSLTDTPVVVAGTWLDEARKLSPTWKLDGRLGCFARR